MGWPRPQPNGHSRCRSGGAALPEDGYLWKLICWEGAASRHGSISYRVKKRFVEDGLEAALGARQGRRAKYLRKADGEFEARLALSCGDPPEGRSQWSLRLLADRAVELGYIDTVSHETVRRVETVAAHRLGDPAAAQRRLRGGDGAGARRLPASVRCGFPGGVHGRDAAPGSARRCIPPFTRTAGARRLRNRRLGTPFGWPRPWPSGPDRPPKAAVRFDAAISRRASATRQRRNGLLLKSANFGIARTDEVVIQERVGISASIRH